LQPYGFRAPAPSAHQSERSHKIELWSLLQQQLPPHLDREIDVGQGRKVNIADLASFPKESDIFSISISIGGTSLVRGSAEGPQMADAEARLSTDKPSVALVVNTFQQAHYLSSALDSAMDQTRPFDEIVVVDDGSTDDPAGVVKSFPSVRFRCQVNAGLAASRNTGLADTTADFVVFLDADDLLLPEAVETGLACHAEHAGCGLVYGGFQRIDAEGDLLGNAEYTPIGEEPFVTLLKGNAIGMHATVMYCRKILMEMGGFDTSLPKCEDYDVYFRIARTHRIASHPNVIAFYRWHGQNMSANQRVMLHWVLRINDRQQPYTRGNPELEVARREGHLNWRQYYGTELIEDIRREWRTERRPFQTARRVAGAAFFAPPYTARQLGRIVFYRLRAAIYRLRAAIRAKFRQGRIDMGDLGTTTPISLDFGFDRGTPVDRFYIEDFLERQRDSIRGRALEVGDASYCLRFGGEEVTHQDVLHVDDGNSEATIVGDLTDSSVLPSDAFDCIVLTQTLHLIFDVHEAARQLFRALRKGGTLLLTVPGITPVERGKWGAMWCWSFTEVSAFKLFAPLFGENNVQVEGHGNVLAATAFIQGLATQELARERLREYDRAYPVIVTVIARKP
jgi:glycosyltransferase involved in cell wall biosynthesis